jgi:GntR family transcriptional regulator/MocR family aminotransferase
MIEAIMAQLPSATIHGAAAGLHLMITFDADVSDVDLTEAITTIGEALRALNLSALRLSCQRV